jgi:hypothetical protein
VYLMRSESVCCRGAHRGNSFNKARAAALLEPRALGGNLDVSELGHAAQQLHELEQPRVQHVRELGRRSVAAERVHGVRELLIAQRQ